MITQLKIVPSAKDRMIEHARCCAPEEACGMMFGLIDDQGICNVIKCVPITNTDHDPMHFTMDVREQMSANKAARRDGLSVVAIWHSHPKGPSRMTKEDIKLAISPDMVWVILSFINDVEPHVHAFTVSESESHPVSLEASSLTS